MTKHYRPLLATVAACSLFLYSGCMQQNMIWEQKPSRLEQLLRKEEPKKLHEALLETIAEAVVHNLMDSIWTTESESQVQGYQNKNPDSPSYVSSYHRFVE